MVKKLKKYFIEKIGIQFISFYLNIYILKEVRL